MEKGQIVELTIEDMSKEGQGIGKADGFAVFVKDTVVGDVVEAEMTKVKKNYGFGRVVKRIEDSPSRQEAFCPYYKQCGDVYKRQDLSLKLQSQYVRTICIRMLSMTLILTRLLISNISC